MIAPYCFRSSFMARGIAKSPEAEAARKLKISESRKRKMAQLGFINSPEARANMSAARIGMKLDEVHKLHIAAAHAGWKPKNFEQMQKLGWAKPRAKGPDSTSWKGDAVGYNALHAWIRRELGKPMKCERCSTNAAKRYEWANKSRKYLREHSDWERLCVSCHRKDGYASGEYVPWNKGKKLKET